jgi:predicted nuclease with TOPRIM domain
LTGKPEDKYAFFTKATELERIDRSYATTLDNINDLKARKEEVEQTTQKTVANVKKLRKEWEQFEALDKMEEIAADISLNLCWATHRDFAKEAHQEEEVSQPSTVNLYSFVASKRSHHFFNHSFTPTLTHTCKPECIHS